MIYTIKNENKNPDSVKALVEKVQAAGGITYAEQKMNDYRDEALDILFSFPDNEVRKTLENLVRYTTDRKY